MILFFVFPWITPAIKTIFLRVFDNSNYLNIIVYSVALVLLFFPSAIIGGTLPIIGRYFIQTQRRTSYELGSLTSLLFSGAAIGIFLGGLIFFHTLGIKQTLIISAFTFLICSFFLKLLLNNIEPKILLENDFYEKQLKLFSGESEKGSRIFRRLAYIALLFLGFLFSSYIIVWARCGYFIQEPQIYSSKILLIVVMIGISIGSLIYSRFYKKHKKLYPVFALIPIFLSAYGILLILFLPSFSLINFHLRTFLPIGNTGNLPILICLLNGLLITLLPSVLIGIAFILANRILLINLQKRGQIIGSSIALFSLGSIAGLLVTGFFLIPQVGLQKSIIFLSMTNFFSGLIIMFVYSFRYLKIKRPSLVFIGVVLILIFSSFIPTNFIQKIYRGKDKDDTLIYAKEGIHSTVSIHKELRTNYFFIASNGVLLGEKPERLLSVKKILSHLPLLLHPHPDSVLVVGFGDGNVLNKIHLHPMKKLDCVEKSPTVVNAAFLFNKKNKLLTNDNTIKIYNMNETNYIKFTRNKYNIIIINCYNPALSGNHKFFTKEYFLSCKQILTSPGIIAVPVPLSAISIEDFKIILRTFLEAYPLASVWYNNNSLNHHVVLIGRKNISNEINVGQLFNNISLDSIKKDLSSSGLDNIHEMLDCFLMGAEELNKMTLGVRINNENRPILEFSMPGTPDNPIIFNHNLQLLKSYREPIFPYITNIDSSIVNKNVFTLILDDYFKSSGRIFDALSSILLGDEDTAINFYQKAHMINNLDKAAKTFLDNYYNRLLYPSPETPFELTENANIFFQKTEFEKAISLLEKAIEIDANYSPAHFALGLNYEVMGDFAAAQQYYKKTLSLKPELQNVKNRLNIVTVLLEEEMY